MAALAKAEAQAEGAGPSATRAKLLQAVAEARRASAQYGGLSPRSPLGRILGGDRLKGLLARSRRDSSRSPDSREHAPEGGAPLGPPEQANRRSITREHGRGSCAGIAAGIASSLGLSRNRIAIPYHVWVHSETDPNPCPSPARPRTLRPALTQSPYAQP